MKNKEQQSKLKQIKLELSATILNLNKDPLSVSIEEYQNRIKLIFNHEYELADVKEALDEIIIDSMSNEDKLHYERQEIPEDFYEGY
jgi:exonuclease VII small subunit